MTFPALMPHKTPADLAGFVWLTFREAVIYSRMNHHKVRQHIYDGDFVARQDGRTWIVNRQSIDDYLTEPDRRMRVAVARDRR